MLIITIGALLALTTAEASTITPSPATLNITGAMAANNTTVNTFNDGMLTDTINDTFKNNTDNIDVSRTMYDLSKPFYLYGVGVWWILIVLGTFAVVVLFSQNMSPFLLIMTVMVGNIGLWGILGGFAEWWQTFTAIAIFSLSMIVISALKGRGQ